MRILKILVEIDGYKKPEQSVVLSDTENVRKYIRYNIVSQMNKPLYARHELCVSVYVIDDTTENDLIPLPKAGYGLVRHYFSDAAQEVWSVELYDDEVTPNED